MVIAGHLINQMLVKVVTELPDRMDIIAEHIRKECGVTHFKFVNSTEVSGPDWTSTAVKMVKWMSFNGLQVNNVCNLLCYACMPEISTTF